MIASPISITFKESISKCICAFSLSVVLWPAAIFAQAVQDARTYEAEARKAYQQKQYESFLDNMKHAANLRPNHPRIMYNLAAAYALNGKTEDALSTLRRLADMGLVQPIANDYDFVSLRNLPAFKQILLEFDENKKPKVKSQPFLTVQEKGVVPESVAYDPVNKTFYLSSVYKRKILSITPEGKTQTFSAASDGLWSVLGMKVDSTRRILWVCTAAHRQMSDLHAEDLGRSSIFKYDLNQGKLIEKYEIQDRTKPHLLGDLAINSAGDVFTTDSVTPAIYVLRHNDNKLQTFMEGSPFVSPQGLDFTPDQKHLFMADYSQGVYLIDVETRKWSQLTSNSTILGIDGLYFHHGRLLGIQNGVTPERIVEMTLDKSLTHVDHFEVIEANNPVFDEVTLGVFVKDDFYFIANSQWGMIDKNGQIAPEEKLKSPVVLRLKL